MKNFEKNIENYIVVEKIILMLSFAILKLILKNFEKFRKAEAFLAEKNMVEKQGFPYMADCLNWPNLIWFLILYENSQKIHYTLYINQTYYQ